MKKIIPCLILLFLTGCTAEYRVNITKKSIDDNIFIYDSIDRINEYNQKTAAQEFASFESDLTNFDKTFVNTDRRKIGYQYKTITDSNHYHEESLARKCYDGLFIEKKKKEIKIYTTNEMNCFENYPDLENVSIYLTSEYKVLETNADEVNNDTYIWHINRENFRNKPLKITLQNDTMKSIVPIIIISIIIVIITFIYLKRNKRIYT